jgi:hypothetical protein
MTKRNRAMRFALNLNYFHNMVKEKQEGVMTFYTFHTPGRILNFTRASQVKLLIEKVVKSAQEKI